MTSRQIAVFRGDDASPEVMDPTLEILRDLNLDLEFIFPLVGAEAIEQTGERFPEESKAQIDAAAATLFGSTSGNSTQALFYLRWGKQTFANVRPCKYMPNAASPLKHPEAIDFAIIRENLEDLYLGLEGPIDDLSALNLFAPHARSSLKDLGPGRYAIKAITEAGAERVIRFAFELARKRAGKRKVTLTSKYNMLHQSDGLFRDSWPLRRRGVLRYRIRDIYCRRFLVPHDYPARCAGCRCHAQPLWRHLVRRCRRSNWRFRSRSIRVLWSRLRLLRIRPWYRPRYPRHECHQPNGYAALRRHDARVSWA